MTISRDSLACGVAAIALMTLAGAPAAAQTPPAATSSAGDAATQPPAGAPAPAADEIVVTGTSIRGVAPVGSNLISVGREAIESTNAQSVQQILRNVPAVVGLSAAGQGSFGSASQSGTNAPTIHGLGASASNSTLNIVDGHRIPLSGVNHTLGDPNMVPANMIERVEVLPEGASSVYGSDAVAGVINFITRRRYEGVRLTGQVGFGDSYRTYQAGIVAGHVWDNGWVTIGYNYSDRSALRVADRSFLAADQRQRAADAGIDMSSATAQNRGNFATYFCDAASIQPAGSTLIYRIDPTTGAYGSPVSNAQANAFCDITQRNDQIPSEKRHNVMMKAEQEVGDRLTVGADILYSNRRNLQRVSRSNGVQATVYGPGSTPPGGAGQINPFFTLPAGVTATSATVRFSGDTLLGPGAQIASGEEHFFVSPRAEYKLSDAWQVTASGVVGISNSFVRDTGRLSASAALLALNGTTNQAGSITTLSVPATGQIVTQLPLTAANALDVWRVTNNRTSAAVLARIADNTIYRQTRQGLQNYRLQVNGDLFDLPAGKVKLALGGEYIAYTVRQNVSQPLGVGPSSAGSSTINLDYDRNVKAGYAELLVPIVSPDMEVPLIRSFEVNVAGRIDDYSDFGSTKNPKFAANWQVFEGLRIRGNWSRSFVAPALTSFGADGRGTTAETSIANGPTNLAVPIAAYPGVNTIPGIVCNATTCTLGTATIQGLQINGGNNQLTAQRGTSWSIGADFTPAFVPGLRLSGTFWHNDFKGGVTAPTAGAAVNIAGLQNLLQVFPTGATQAQINAIVGSRPLSTSIPGTTYYVYDFRQRNVLSLNVEGVDADVRYNHRADWGSFNLGAAMSLKTKFDQSFGGGPTFSVLNTTGFNTTFPSIRLDLRGDANVTVGPVSATVFVNHNGGYRNFSPSAINPVVSVGGVPTGGGDRVKAFTTFDLNLSYTLPKSFMSDTEFYVDVQNLFDKTPPFYASSQGYDTFSGNPILRVITVGVRAAF